MNAPGRAPRAERTVGDGLAEPPPARPMLDGDGRKALKRAFGAYPTGVTVVTTHGDGAPRGFTANSFTSLSIDPPLLLVCHDDRANSAPVFRSAPGFTVNVLAADQEALAMRFAGGEGDRFAGLDCEPGEGGPILPGVAAWLDCATHAIHGGGDHSILVGRIVAHRDAERDPLAYWRGRFYPGFPPD